MFYVTALNIDATTIPGEFLVDFIFNSIPPGMFHMGDDISNSSKLSKTRMLDPKPRIFFSRNVANFGTGRYFVFLISFDF